MPLASQAPLALTDRAQLFTHLAAMEKAGMPTDQAFALLNLAAEPQRRVVRMRQQLSQGQDVASAGYKAGLFTPLDVTLLKAALSVGSPAPVYQRLAETYTRQARNAATVRTQLRRPLLVFALALFIQPLPALVGGSLGLVGYLWAGLQPLLLLAAAVYLVRQGWRWLESDLPSARRQEVERVLLGLPLFGPFILRRRVRDFFESLALMLEAGLPLLEALPLACATFGQSSVRGDFAALQSRVAAGQSLAQAIEPLNFPNRGQALAFIRTGEGSGTLPAMLLRHAQGETQAVDSFQQELAVWGPRLVYGGLMLWMAYGLVAGAAFQPQLPPGL
ncbi:MAG: type II secretion system F family protein [Pseudomonadota bacterium]